MSNVWKMFRLKCVCESHSNHFVSPECSVTATVEFALLYEAHFIRPKCLALWIQLTHFGRFAVYWAVKEGKLAVAQCQR